MTAEPHTTDPHSAADVVTMDKLVSLAKRRGFVFPSSEIYGGLGASYDYGPKKSHRSEGNDGESSSSDKPPESKDKKAEKSSASEKAAA